MLRVRTLVVPVLLIAFAMAGCVTTVSQDVMTSCGATAATSPQSGLPDPLAQALVPTQPVQIDDQPLILGSLLPLSGSLAAFGPSMQNGAELAISQINSAGGINGHDVGLIKEDSRTDKTQAPNAFNSLVNNDVVGVVGAASSGVTGSILDLAMDNEVFVMSPASTSPALTTERDNEGWFARVPPSDALQGKVLAKMVHDDGCRDVNILAVNNAYGVGLGGVFEATFEAMGGTVGQTVLFEEGGTTFASQVERAGSGSPDAIVFIGYPTEGTQVVKEAFEKGIMAESVFFFSEGVKDPTFVTSVGEKAGGGFVLSGLRGTVPESVETEASNSFKAAYAASFDGQEPGLFAAETYDAVWSMALAAAVGGENSGIAIKDNIRMVVSSPGTEVSGGNGAAAIAAATLGADIDYVGASNDFDLDENGDPADGIYSYWRVTQDGSIETMEGGISP